MRAMPSKTETLLLPACACPMAAALLGPAVQQPMDYRAFADQRILWGVPFAMSNVQRALAALAVLAALRALRNSRQNRPGLSWRSPV